MLFAKYGAYGSVTNVTVAPEGACSAPALSGSAAAAARPDPRVEQVIRDVLRDFGVCGICVFGSYPSGRAGAYSDYDFTVLCDRLPDDVGEREAYSPAIKDALRAVGIPDICAFNLYTADEFYASKAVGSWLPETMAKAYWIIDDRKGVFGNTFGNGLLRRVGDFAWEGVRSENPARLFALADRYRRTAALLVGFPDIRPYFAYESERVSAAARSYVSTGAFATRGELIELDPGFGPGAAALKIDCDRAKENCFLPGADLAQRDAARLLAEAGFYRDALAQAYASVRYWLLRRLWSSGSYPIDGEVTQIFLRDAASTCPVEVAAAVRRVCYKVEQVLGRCGYISFDLRPDGRGEFTSEEEAASAGLLDGLESLRSSFADDAPSGLEIRAESGVLVPNGALAVADRARSDEIGLPEKPLTLILSKEESRPVRPLAAVRVANRIGMRSGTVLTPRAAGLDASIFF